MRQWRVGSFSLGLLLVLMGIGLLVDRYSGTTSTLEFVSNWWPVVLILLGAEVLVVGFLSRNENIKFKYDGWSVVLVIVLFFFGMISYAVSYSGVMPRIQEALSMDEYVVELSEEQISLDSINKVVINYSGDRLELRSTPSSSLHIFGQGTLHAPSHAEALRLAEEYAPAVYVAEGTLFINLNSPSYMRGMFYRRDMHLSRTILVPADMPLELQGRNGHNSVIIDSLQAPWQLQFANSVNVSLDPGLDLQVNAASGFGSHGLSGNVSWQHSNTEEPWSLSTLSLGQGGASLTIRSDHDITVNTR